MKRIKLIVVLTLLVLLFGGFFYVRQSGYVIAKVTDKKITPPKEYTQLRYDPKTHEATKVTAFTAPRFEVTISYKDLSVTYDSIDLFEAVHVGDYELAIVKKSYDEDGNLTGRSLELPVWSAD